MKKGRAKIYFDSIDLEIMELLNKPVRKNNGQEIGHSVLDVAKKLNLNHKNLKPHIDKLRNLGLILIYSNGNKAALTTPVCHFNFMDEIGFYEENEFAEDKKDAEEFEIALKMLKKVRKLFFEKEHNKKIELDLRKINSLEIKNTSKLKEHSKSRVKKQ